MPGSVTDLDELDQKIISLLVNNGRLTNVEVARRLVISEATARRRVERLLHDHMVNVVAVPDPERAAHEVQVMVAIQAEPGRADTVAQYLASLSQTRYVVVVSGPYDVLAEIVVPAYVDLLEALRQHISGHAYIKNVQTLMILHTVKIGHRVVAKREREASTSNGPEGARSPHNAGQGEPQETIRT